MTTGNIYEDFTSTDDYGLGYGARFVKSWAGVDRVGNQNAIADDHVYQMVAVKFKCPKIQFRFRGSSGPYTSASAQYFGPVYGFPDSNVKNSNINRMYGDIKQHDFNAAISLAETNKNVKMIGDAALKIAKAYKAASHGDLVKASQVLTGNGRTPDNKVARNWLELQYGWLPLLGDAYKAANYVKSRTALVKLGSHRTRKKSVQAAISPVLVKLKTCEIETRHQMILKSYQFVNEFDGLGFSDPASVLWELVPYSFVIDWFLPIGNFLEAANASRVTVGTMVSTYCEIVRASGLQSSSIVEVIGGESYDYSSITMGRTVGPMPSASMPTANPLQKVMSLGHTMNGIALLNNLHR